MKWYVTLILVAVLLPIAIIACGWMVMTTWNWYAPFVVPTAPVLSLKGGIALAILVMTLTYRYQPDDDWTLNQKITCAIIPFVLFGLGAIVRLFL